MPWKDMLERYRLALLGIILVTGALLRLAFLGEISLRADTLLFWNLCQSASITAGDLLTRWTQFNTDQPPLPLVLTKWMIDGLGLPVTFFTIRLPSALLGIACIPVLYWAGRKSEGTGMGLLLAALIALAPFHIQMSMEAYYYSGLIFGSVLLFAAFLDAATWNRQGRRPGAWFYVFYTAGFAFMVHSQFTGWPLAFLLSGSIILLAMVEWKKKKLSTDHLYAIAAILVAQGVLLLLVPWGPRYILAKTSSPQKEIGQQVAEMTGETEWSMLHRVFASFGFGGTGLRAILTLGILAIGVVVLIRQRDRWMRNGLIGLMIAGSFVAFFVTRQSIGAMYESRYVAGLLPVVLLILAYGLLPGGGSLSRKWSLAAAPVALLLLSYPAWLSATLSGQPTPYLKVTHYMDEHLAPGTPVLVDRWFEPWNELAAHPSSNAVYTFTYPNEPVDQFRQINWRKTAIDFLTRNPDAGYLEVAKSYWEVADIGSWEWPREFFRHQIAFTNDAGLKLRNLQLAARGDFYADNTNRLVVEFFYNTRDDVLAQWREQGREFGLWYGEGWRFEKSGPMGTRVQTRDFRDWRMMSSQATLEVVNLTREPVQALLRVRGLALNGDKQLVGASRFSKGFKNGELTVWQMGPITLAPEATTPVNLRDAGQTGAAVLLVDAVDVVRAP